MLISDVSRITKLTKKAIEYYAEQGLVLPHVLENGYRDFNEGDIECLKKISIYRRLGLSAEEIKTVFADKTASILQKIALQRELDLQFEQAKKSILDTLSYEKSYPEANTALIALEQNTAVAEKLLQAFPGYYGRLICLHFARFLSEPIVTNEQQKAYAKIVNFLDNAPSLNFPNDVQEFLYEYTKHIGTEHISAMIKDTKHYIENPDDFLLEHKEVLEYYSAYKKTAEYKNSPAYKMAELLKKFNSISGYYSVFIPAMRELSPSYAEYCVSLEVANKKLLLQHTEIATA